MQYFTSNSHSKTSHPAWVRYCFAAAVSSVAITVDLWISRELNHPIAPFLLGFGAVIVASAWAGLGPGLFATALGVSWGVFVLHRDGASTASVLVRAMAFTLEAVLLAIGSRYLRRATLRAQASEEWHRNLVETSNEGIWVVDGEGTITYANPRIGELIGCRAEELVGQPVNQFFFPADQPMERIRTQNRRPGKREQFDRRLRRKNGTEVWVLACGSPISGVVGGLGVLEMLTDITERKRAEQALRVSEQRFRELFENVLEGVYQSTPDGRIVAANPMLLDMLGMTSEKEMNEVNISSDLYVDQAVRRRLLDRLEREGSFQNVEYQLRRRDGRIITVRENARAVRDEAGNIVYYEGTLSDVTEQIYIESELLKARSRESVEAVAATMPNEFRNILTVISGYSKLLLEDLPEPHPARIAAQAIARTVDDAAALTAQLAAFSGRSDKGAVDVNRAVLLAEGSARRHLSPWSLPVLAEQEDIERIVDCLTRNATEISVDAVNLDIAFTRAHPGTRAGLFARISAAAPGSEAISAPENHTTISKCGGFSVSSGANFVVYLPIAQNAVRFLSARVSAPKPRETVLLVQEEPLIREVSRDLLERLGYGVLLAADTHEAERIQELGHEFDVMITDIHAPAQAAALVQHMRQNRPEIKVIVVSERPATDAVQSADAYIERPFSSESLDNEIRRLLKT